MTTSINIHPQTSRDKLQFNTTQFDPTNANCVHLKFSSREFYDRNKEAVYTVDTEVTAFHLPDATAESLYLLGQLDQAYLEKLLPIMRDMLNEQHVEADNAA